MGLGSTREPVPALRLRSGVPSRPAHPLPADRAGGAHAKSGRGLTAGQARLDGGQNTRAEVEGQRFRHTGWPPSPARTLNQIGPDLGTPTDSIGANTALAPLPIVLVELLARLCVADAMAGPERNRAEQTSFVAAVGDL
jgi:hypothetical protein